MSELDNIARIDVPNSMVYKKTPSGEETVSEHGPRTVTYVPDGTEVAVLEIDPKDDKSVSLAKLDTLVKGKEFVDLETYKNVVAPIEIKEL